MARANELSQMDVDTATQYLEKKQTAASAKAGFRWQKKHQVRVYREFADDLQTECSAVFIAGLSVCNKGEMVDIGCGEGGPTSGPPAMTRIGCDCEGVLLEGKVLGYMSEDKASTCVKKMSTWSARSKLSFLKVGTAQSCAAKAYKACSERGKKAAERAKMKDMAVQNSKNEMFLKFQISKKAIMDKNREARKRNEALRKRLAAPTPKYTFNEVPGFGLPGAGTPAKDNGACRTLCMQMHECKGYSFCQDSLECIWTKKGIEYDYQYILYIKAIGQNTDLGSFTSVAGMKLGANAPEVDAMGAPIENSAHNKANSVEQKTLHECKYDCWTSEKCMNFSYNQEKQLCVSSSTKLHVGSSWNYYERVAAHDPHAELQQFHKSARVETKYISDKVEAYKDLQWQHAIQDRARNGGKLWYERADDNRVFNAKTPQERGNGTGDLVLV